MTRCQKGVGCLLGDHDYTWNNGIIDDRSSTLFSDYIDFPLTRSKVVAYYEKGHMENVVVENYIQGRPYYFLILEFGPRVEVVNWANEYVKSHKDIQFILLNHEYLGNASTRISSKLKCEARLRNTSYTTPNELWERLIYNNNNILCVLCGHTTALFKYSFERNAFNRSVPQILHYIQAEEYRKDNWLMLWEFSKESKAVIVSIVNAATNRFYEDNRTLFEFNRV